MTACKGSRSKAPLILNLEMELSGQHHASRFIPVLEPQYPWNRWLGGPQSGTGHFGEESLYITEIRIRLPSHNGLICFKMDLFVDIGMSSASVV